MPVLFHFQLVKSVGVDPNTTAYLLVDEVRTALKSDKEATAYMPTAAEPLTWARIYASSVVVDIEVPSAQLQQSLGLGNALAILDRG